MAEFLIFNKENWMDVPSKQRPDLIGYENVQRKIDENGSLNITQKEKAQINITNKYNARSRPGDIVEARQNGFGLCGDEPLSFALIKVPPMSLEDAKRYEGILRDEPRVKYNHKCSLDMSGIILIKNETTLTSLQFNSILIEKT